MTDRKRTWFITGCSSGFGRELSLELVDRGEIVVATARRFDAIADLVALAPDRVIGLPVDVTNRESIDAAVEHAIDRFGRIDVLVNNAGYALVGGVEEVSDEEARAIFDTNFFGFIATTQAVLPVMRQQQRGHIINISSMGGISGGVGMAYYGATKFAMAGVSESLAQEVAPLGIKVTVVEPGGHQTKAIAGARVAARIIDDYALSVGRHRAAMAQVAGNEPGDARLAARAIIAAVNADEPPLHIPLGADAVARLDRKLATLKEDRDRWLDLSLSTAMRH